MAGRSPEKPGVHDVLLSWMFDYTFYRTWNMFEKYTSIPEAEKDLIQGLSAILLNYPEKNEARQKWLFIVSVCRMDDGEDNTFHYEEDSDETPLESLLTTFNDLVNYQEIGLKEEGLNLIPLIRSEAVLVCCRAGDFDQAKVVFDKLWGSKKLHNEGKQICKMLKNVIVHKNSKDESIMTSYKDFVETMKNYLKKIFKQFPKPFLLEVAKNRLNSEKQLDDTEEEIRRGTKRPNSDRNLKPSMLNNIKENEHTGNEEMNSAAKLQKQWSQTVDKLFDHTEPLGIQEVGQLLPPSPVKIPRKEPSKTRSSDGPQPSTPNLKKADLTTEENPKPSTSTNETALRTEMTYRGEQNRHEPINTNHNHQREDSSKRDHLNIKESPKPSTSTNETGLRTEMTYRGEQNRHEPINTNHNHQREDSSKRDHLNISTISKNSNTNPTVSKRQKWTESEVEEFYDVVMQIGVGKWGEIKDFMKTNRTNVMLKDKWRTMLKSGDVERLAKNHQRTKRKN